MGRRACKIRCEIFQTFQHIRGIPTLVGPFPAACGLCHRPKGQEVTGRPRVPPPALPLSLPRSHCADYVTFPRGFLSAVGRLFLGKEP